MLKAVYEIFEQFETAKSREEKIQVLRENNDNALRNILRGTYDNSIQFVITEIPKYKPSDSPIGMGYTSIHSELARMYLFEKDNPKVASNLSAERKNQLLVQILEALESKEAEVYCRMLLKKPQAKGMTYNLVKEAFPDLLP